MENIILERTFNLREDVAPGIGKLIPGNFTKRYYGSGDLKSIEECIYFFINKNVSGYMIKHSGVPEDRIKVDLTLYGKLNETMLAALGLDLEKWDIVSGLNYIKPGADTERLLPREYSFDWM